MRNITIADLDQWVACHRKDGEQYSDENLKRIFRGRESLTPLQVLRLRSVSAIDKLWTVLREEVLGEDVYFRAGHAFARRVVKKYCLDCGIKLVEKFAKEYLTKENNIDSAAIAAEAALAAESAWAARAVMAARSAMAARAWMAAWAARATEEWAVEVEEQIKILKQLIRESEAGDE